MSEADSQLVADLAAGLDSSSDSIDEAAVVTGRDSKKSADWCIEAVATCWKAKVGSIRAAEKAAAQAAYERASQIYTAIAKEATDE